MVHRRKKRKPVEEIEDDVVDLVSSKSRFFFVAYDDGLTSDPKDYEDDNFIHISRGKYRFVFYNGQGKGRLTENHIPRYTKLVNNALKKRKI